MRNNYRDENWIGQKFGRLTIQGYETVRVRDHVFGKFVVKCDCGSTRLVTPNKLLTGHTNSCGCAKIERCKDMTMKYRIKHGGRHERLYRIWHGMMGRCYNRNNKDYKNWGGRGIIICGEWKTDYAAFRSWAMSNGYSDNLTIDRIDVNGDYAPDNCRWIPLAEQGRNRRDTHMFQYGGKVRCISEIAVIAGVKYQTLYKWAIREGLPLDEALKKCPKHPLSSKNT